MKSNQKISAKYNRLIIHIQLVKCQHFYPPPPKKYFSQQEDTGVRWAALTQKKEKPTLQFPESLNSFPSCLIQVFGEFTKSEYEQVPFVSVTASSPHLVRLSYLIFVPGSNRKGCFFYPLEVSSPPELHDPVSSYFIGKFKTTQFLHLGYTTPPDPVSPSFCQIP